MEALELIERIGKEMREVERKSGVGGKAKMGT